MKEIYNSEDFKVKNCIIVDKKYLKSILQPKEVKLILKHSKPFQPEMSRAYETGWVFAINDSDHREDFEESLYEYIHDFEII